MEFFADFHIHSKYSRATSQLMDLENLDRFAQIKGIKLLGCGDFTHPAWLKELKENLKEEDGLYRFGNTYFILTGEVSCIYPKNGRIRKIHNIIFAPSFSVVEKIIQKLAKYGNLNSDGRPLLSLSSEDLIKIVLDISSECLIVPAHIWTPHFSLFGANSGFDSIEEAFGEYKKYIYCLETGLSSDPAMNWRVSSLDNFTLISNSDSHSPSRIGREANVLNCELTYKSVIQTLKNKDRKKFLYTVEFFPEEGKYHYDGHRRCGICFSPKETRRNNYICPVCNSPLTIGVMHRVESLADRDEGIMPTDAIPFYNLVPLDEIIAAAIGQEPETVKVKEIYNKMIYKLGNEFNILLKEKIENIKEASSERIAEGIERVRNRKITLSPGYDGEYGKVKIFEDEDRKNTQTQMSLF